MIQGEASEENSVFWCGHEFEICLSRFYSLEVTSKRERKEKKDLRENENNVGRRKKYLC